MLTKGFRFSFRVYLSMLCIICDAKIVKQLHIGNVFVLYLFILIAKNTTANEFK